MENHYDNLQEEWRKKALSFDYKERYEALGLPGYNEGDLPIAYYGIQYMISRKDAGIYYAKNPGRKVENHTALPIYHLFYYSKKAPLNSNRFIPFRDVKNAGPFDPAYQKMTIAPFARVFNGKKALLIAAGEKLGFKRLADSDAGFEGMAFACMPVRFLFWDGDDEFPAQANVLFDANITDFTHEETVVSIGDDGVRLLIGTARDIAEHQI